MSKNMIRKSLAFGAGLALVSTGLVASPALAVDDITLDAFYGPQEFSALQGDDYGFVFGTVLNNIGSASASDLKYNVETVNVETYAEIDGGGVNVTTIAASNLAGGTTDQFFGANDFDATSTAPGDASAAKRVFVPTSFGEITIVPSAGATDADSTGTVLTFAQPHPFKVGDTVVVTGVDTTSTGDAITGGEITAATATSITFDASGDTADDAEELVVGGLATVTGPSRGSTEGTNLSYFSVSAQDLTAVAGNEALTVKVQAWIDTDRDNVVDANEFKSPVRELTFHAVEDVEVSPTFDFTALGAASLSGELDITGVNMRNFFEVLNENTADDLIAEVDYTTAAGASARTVPTDGTTALTYDALTDKYDWSIPTADLDILLDNTDDATDAVIVGNYTVSLFIGSTTAANEAGTGAFTGNESTNLTEVDVETATLNNIDLSVATSSSVAQGTTLAGGAGAIKALSGTKTLSFTATGWTDAGKTVAGGSGMTYRVTLTDTANGLDTSTITSNGVSLKATGLNAVSFNLTSDVNGQVTFDVVADNAVAGETFKVSVAADGKSATEQTVTWADEALSLVANPTTDFKIAPQSSMSVDYTLYNQFGVVPAGEYQLSVTRAVATSSTTTRDEVGEYASWAYKVPLNASGRGTVTITDNGSATLEGSDTVTVTVEKKATNGVFAPTTSTDFFTLTYENDLKAAVLSTTVNNNGLKAGTVDVLPIALETEALTDFDSAVLSVKPDFSDNNIYDSTTDTTTNSGLVKISGTVKTAAGVGISGVPVKVAAAGMNFANGATVSASSLMLNDSIVVPTGAGGSFAVYVRSAVGGTQSVSIESAGKTSSVSLKFATGGTAAKAMTLDLPASARPGTSTDVVAKLTDAAGNPVEGVAVTFKEVGPGYLNSASGTSDASGEVVVNLITLSADSGTSTVTATASVNGVSTSVSKTMTVGASAATEGKVNVGSFNGKLVVYALGLDGARITWKVGGVWGQEFAVGDTLNRFDRPTPLAGATVSVDIWVDGAKRLTKSVVTR
jgi:hypothetical protein